MHIRKIGIYTFAVTTLVFALMQILGFASLHGLAPSSTLNAIEYDDIKYLESMSQSELNKKYTFFMSKEVRGWTPLFFAAQHCKEKSISALVARGVDIFANDELGTTPVYLIASYSRSDGECLKNLRALGLSNHNINFSCNKLNDTVLHIVAGRGYVESTRYLLGGGANVTILNKDGRSPFSCAVLDAKDPLLVELFLEHGARVSTDNTVRKALDAGRIDDGLYRMLLDSSNRRPP